MAEDSRKSDPQRSEVEALLKLIDHSIFNSRISKRQLERLLDQGQGYIGSLLKGRINLKVGHVYDIGEALGIEPLVMFYRAAPRENQERLLKELGLQPPPSDPPPDPPPPPMTREAIEALIRKVVRQELARLATS